MKSRYSVSLEKEVAELGQAKAQKYGLSFSAFVSMLITKCK